MKKKQFAIIGLGRFGTSLAKTLHQMGHEVIAIDINEQTIEDIADEVTYAVQADAADEGVLDSIGLKNVDIVVVAIASDIQASILATLNAKELGIKRVYAKAMNDKHSKVLYKIGTDRVFLPERDMGSRVAHYLASNNILELIELDASNSIIEINAADEWQGKTLGELDFRAKYGVNVIALKRGAKLNISPVADDKIGINDILVIIGDNHSIGKFNDQD